MAGNLFHWGPLLALGIIKLVSWTTIHCTAHWLPLTQSFVGVTNAIIFFGLAFLTIYNFMCSIFIGPGFVPLHWRPKKKEDEQFLQFCLACDGYKAPRSHHCRKCGRCVLKMDHHCPWINNCVGHHNHRYFVSFLFFAICGSLHSFGLLILTVYKLFIVNIYYVKTVPAHLRLSLTWFVLCIFSIGMTLGVFFALSFLLYIQVKSILKNCTGIEDWILEKADERRHMDPTLSTFIFPYHLGWRENIRQVFSSSEFSDGLSWKVRPGCSEYDLTIEQRKQKELKKMRKRPYKVVKKYSGAIFPVVNGFCTCLRPPCSAEKRMRLHIDETILVTRYQKYWMFGERTVEKNEIPEKGWFPKSCLVPITDYSNHGYVPKVKKDS